MSKLLSGAVANMVSVSSETSNEEGWTDRAALSEENTEHSVLKEIHRLRLSYMHTDALSGAACLEGRLVCTASL